MAWVRAPCLTVPSMSIWEKLFEMSQLAHINWSNICDSLARIYFLLLVSQVFFLFTTPSSSFPFVMCSLFPCLQLVYHIGMWLLILFGNLFWPKMGGSRGNAGLGLLCFTAHTLCSLLWFSLNILFCWFQDGLVGGQSLHIYLPSFRGK